MRILLIGYGNPGRLDDGLGPALVERLEQNPIPNLTADANYQLSVEDAHAVKDYDTVIFADASLDCREPFEFYEITGKASLHFTSHFLAPEDVLGLARDLFQAQTRGYVLAVRGYEFDAFGEQLSKKAVENLDHALAFLQQWASRHFQV